MKESPLKDNLTQDIPGDIGISHRRSSCMASFLFFILVLSYLGAFIGFIYFGSVGMPPAYMAGSAIGFAIEILLLHALLLAFEKALEAEAIAAYALNKLNNVPSEYLGCITSADFEQQKRKEQTPSLLTPGKGITKNSGENIFGASAGDKEAHERFLLVKSSIINAPLQILEDPGSLTWEQATLREGFAVLVSDYSKRSLVAYWIKEDKVFAVNQIAKRWSPQLRRSPTGVDFHSVEVAIIKSKIIL